MSNFEAFLSSLAGLAPISMVDVSKLASFYIFYISSLLLYVGWGFVTSVFTLVGLLFAVAYFTLAERKVMASMQRRRGPSIVGFWGLLQPIADGVKLLSKEVIIPSRANKVVFLLAPVLSFALAFGNWGFVPFTPIHVFIESNFSALLIFAFGSLGVYGVVLAGWSSNSKYSFLGGLRSSAQMISYEIPMSLVVVIVAAAASSYNFLKIVESQEAAWFFFGLAPICLIFFISGLAETNRAPFDLPEGESEIASGYNLEYSGILFALFFLAEYANMILISALTSLYFFGGWFYADSSAPFEIKFGTKVLILCFFFVWVRATLPRYRYDQLMSLGWRIFIPLCLGFFSMLAAAFYTFGSVFLNTLW